MRGDDQQLQSGMFSYVALEDRIPADHPLRGVRKLVDAVLAEMSNDLEGLYSKVGRPSIPPERLLRALLLQVFYSVRSERLLMEQLNYNLLFRWFVGLEIDDPVWNHAVFSKNRDRLLNQDLAQRFFAHVKAQATGLMSDEHFTVDGTLIEAWAGQKSFSRKDDDKDGDGGAGDFRGEQRRNQTHASSTDPEARLYKKSAGQEAKLSYLGHTLVENRNGLIAAAMTTQADGRAERDAALLMLHELSRKRGGRITTGADRAYDTRDFVSTVRELGVTPLPFLFAKIRVDECNRDFATTASLPLVIHASASLYVRRLLGGTTVMKPTRSGSQAGAASRKPIFSSAGMPSIKKAIPVSSLVYRWWHHSATGRYRSSLGSSATARYGSSVGMNSIHSTTGTGHKL